MSSSPTLTVRSDNFVAKAISFENSYNLEEFEAQRIFLPKTFDQIDAVGSPVPALAVQIGGDKHAFYQCGFLGYQDTILDLEGRHYFSECYIEGAVDFIFGGGQSFYEKCDINITGYGYITAQGRDGPDKQDGFVFESCNVFGTGPTYLGRAYGPYSRVIYHSCTIDVNVEAPGWDAWTYTGHEGNFTYVESDCKGAHYDASKRVTWLKNLETDRLSAFTRDTFINQEGWIQKIPT